MVTELILTESNDEQSQHVQEASVLIFFYYSNETQPGCVKRDKQRGRRVTEGECH